MTILPIQANRTSSVLSAERALTQLNSDQIALQEKYEQLSTGRRLLTASDDPAAAGRAISLQRGISRSDQLVRNANATQAYYQSTDAALNRIDGGLIEARGVTVTAAQNVLSQTEREALAQTLDQVLASVLAGGNSMFRDHQLLGGILEPGNAFSWDEEEVVFTGTTAIGQTHLGAGVPSPLNVNGTDSLGALGVTIKGKSLQPAVTPETRLVDMRGGDGIQPGVIRLSDGTGFQEIDFSDAATVGDIIEKFESLDLGGRQLEVTVGGDSFSIDYADGNPGTLALEDMPGSGMISNLGVHNPSGLIAPPLTGVDLAPRITAQTRLDDLNNGAGIDVSAGIILQQGDERFTIDLSEAETLGDVLIEFNRSEADVRVTLDPKTQQLNIHALRSGVDYSIGENGGDAARLLGIRSATEETQLADLGKGVGINFNPGGADLEIVRPNGVVLELELSVANSIQDVIDLIESHPLNQDTQRILVQLNSVGNGLELYTPPGANPMIIRQPGVSDAGLRLGLIPAGQGETVGEISDGAMRIVGDDYLPREAGGVVDTLLRLRKAVLDGDIPTITRLQETVDSDLARASKTRGRIGVWQQNLDEMRAAVEDETILMKSQLSNEVDADLAEVISELTRRQTAMEASLRVIGQTANQTVLNYL